MDRLPFRLLNEGISRVVEDSEKLKRIEGLVSCIQETRKEIGLKPNVILFGSSSIGGEVRNKTDIDDGHDIDLFFDMSGEISDDWIKAKDLYPIFSVKLAQKLNDRRVYKEVVTAKVVQHMFCDWGGASTVDLFKYGYYLIIGDEVQIAMPEDN